MGRKPQEQPLVVVVDDDDAVRDSLGMLLRSRRYRVATYPDATSLLQALPLPEQTCIISDIHMPGMDGLALIRRLRELGHPGPVITITGRKSTTTRSEALAAGALEFLEKPVPSDLVLSKVHEALASAAPGRSGA